MFKILTVRLCSSYCISRHDVTTLIIYVDAEKLDHINKANFQSIDQ